MNGKPLRLAYVILQVLANARGEMYGREIIDKLGSRGGSFYPEMRRLCDAGLVDRRPEPREIGTGRPPRTYYRLTESGKAASALPADQMPRLLERYDERIATLLAAMITHDGLRDSDLRELRSGYVEIRLVTLEKLVELARLTPASR